MYGHLKYIYSKSWLMLQCTFYALTFFFVTWKYHGQVEIHLWHNVFRLAREKYLHKYICKRSFHSHFPPELWATHLLYLDWLVSIFIFVVWWCPEDKLVPIKSSNHKICCSTMFWCCHSFFVLRLNVDNTLTPFYRHEV